MTEDMVDKKKTGEFYTPNKVAKLMADLLFEDFDPENSPEPRVFDPSCGDGQLIVAVYLKLYELYLPFTENMELLKKHIIKDMLFGMDIDINGLEKTKARLFELTHEDSKNFYQCDFLMDEGNIIAGLKESFTHVIGNPPYIGHKNLALDYKKKLKNAYPEVYVNKTDILSCFFPGAMKFLKNHGKLVFITSRYFLEAPTYMGLRNFLQEYCTIKRIIDFDFLNMFKEARVASCITVLENRKELSTTLLYDRYFEDGKNIFKTEGILPTKEKTNKQDSHRIEIPEFGSFRRFIGSQKLLHENGWSFPTEYEMEIRERIERKGNYSLRDIFTSYQGIITGCDKAFVIKDTTETEGWNEKELKLLRPWIKNSFVGKYFIKEQGYTLIYSDDIKDLTSYPKVLERLEKHRDKLENRREVKRNFRKWYELQWGRVEEVFKRKKIVHPYKAHENRFAVDENGNLCSADVYIMLPKDGFEPYMEYITVLLNSTLYDTYFKSFGKRMGGKIFDYYPNKVMEMRVYIPEKMEEIAEILRLYKALVCLNSYAAPKKNSEEQRNRLIERSTEKLMENQETFTKKSGEWETLRLKLNREIENLLP